MPGRRFAILRLRAFDVGEQTLPLPGVRRGEDIRSSAAYRFKERKRRRSR
jgi:hypothetical protein